MSMLLVTFILLLPVRAFGEVLDADSGATGGFVDVSSSSAGIRIGPDAIKTAMRFRVKTGAATGVCINYVDRMASCATALTNPDNAGHCLFPDDTYLAMVSDEHWRGQICAILPTGSTPVRVPFNAW